MYMLLDDWAIKELAVIVVLPPATRALPVKVMALSDFSVVAPVRVTVLFVCAVKELALMDEPSAVRLLPVMVRALSDLRLEPLARVIALPVCIVMELALMVVASVLFSVVDVIVNPLLVVIPDLSANTTLLLVKEAALRDKEPLLPETSIKEEVKAVVELLTLSVELATWIESLVKLAALKVTLAFICIRV